MNSRVRKFYLSKVDELQHPLSGHDRVNKPNRTDKYQKGAIYIDNTGSMAQIINHHVRGGGAVNLIAQNGIQVSREAAAAIRRNRVSDNA